MSDNMSEENKLLPCPFCGEMNLETDGVVVWHGVVTDPCIIAGTMFHRKPWNTRATDSDATPPAPIEGLGIERGQFHDAFWKALFKLPDNLKKQFSIDTGRTLANEIYDEAIKEYLRLQGGR